MTKNWKAMMSFIGEYWRGEKELWKAFWLWGFLFQPLLFMVVGFFIFPSLLYILFSLAYWIWSCFSIWRCASNSDFIWLVLARIWAVIMFLPITLAAILSLLFIFAMITGSTPDIIDIPPEYLPESVQEKMIDGSHTKADKNTLIDVLSKQKTYEKTIYIEDLVPNEDGMIEIPRNANLISREEEQNGN